MIMIKIYLLLLFSVNNIYFVNVLYLPCVHWKLHYLSLIHKDLFYKDLKSLYIKFVSSFFRTLCRRFWYIRLQLQQQICILNYRQATLLHKETRLSKLSTSEMNISVHILQTLSSLSHHYDLSQDTDIEQPLRRILIKDMTVTFNVHILSDIPFWLMLNLFRSGRREQTYMITGVITSVDKTEDEEGVPYKELCIRYDIDIQSHFW